MLPTYTASVFKIPLKFHKFLRIFGIVTLILLVATVITKVLEFPIDNDLYEIITSGQFTQLSSYQQIFKSLYKVRPRFKCPPKLDNYPNGRAKERFTTDTDLIFSREYLNSLLQVEPECLEELSKSHADYLKFLETTDIEFGDLSSLKGNGIVMVGGGKFNILTLINVQWLKHLKSTLPIEVFIGSKEEYDENFCNEILPKFGAPGQVKCNLLWDHMSESTYSKFKFKGFQYKMLLLLISNFESILFLDADNVPVKAPDHLFASEVFLEKGLVLWPDVWSRTTSPKYYEDILHKEIGKTPIRGRNMDKEEFDYHDLEGTVPNPTSESGMILVNKKTKSKMLLLSLYYNIFGPDYYYPLFTQGGAGEGDKETFINAATVLGTDYYQVKQRFAFIGYNEDGFHSKALAQHDPVQDYLNSKMPLDAEKPKIGVLFMHMSYPKLIPDLLIHNKELKNEETGKHRRLYGINLGYDFELQINEVFTQLLCLEYDSNDDIITVASKGAGVELKVFEDRKRLQDQCRDYFIPHVKFLKENPL